MLRSDQISGMISSQMGMFQQQNAYAHQIGGVLPQRWPGMAPSRSYGNPSYGGQDFGIVDTQSPGGFGAGMVGGVGGAIGGVGRIADMVSLGAGVGSMFPGVVGAGLAGTLGTVSSLAAPVAIGAGFAGKNIYEGAHNISQVGAMANTYFGPAYGVQGARPGGQFSRETVRQITSALHDIAGDDTMNMFQDLKKVMDKAGSMGMLTGITNAGEFKTKFKGLVGQITELAKVMGSSLEEAAPLFGQMRQMGMWRPEDVMGTAAAMKMSGPGGAGALLSTMGAGARGSFAMGGTLSAGATLGRSQFLNVQEAVRTGALTDEAVMQLTGGVGGVEGQQMLSERMTGVMQSMTQTAVGRLSMAGLGETRNGRFTGKIDKSKMNKFLAGSMSVDDLQRAGMGATGTREGAASFTAREDILGQNMMAEGGMELVGQMTQAALDRAGFGNATEEIQQLMVQKLYGIGARDAQTIQKLVAELPKIMDSRTQRAKRAMEDAFRSIDERQNRSFKGISESLGKAFEETLTRPIQEFAETATTRANEAFDRLTDTVLRRRRGVTTSDSERMRLLTGQVSAPSLGQYTGQDMSSVSMEERLDTPIAEALRRGGLSAMFGFGGQRGELMRSLGADLRKGTTTDIIAGLGRGEMKVSTDSGRFLIGNRDNLENTMRLGQRRVASDFNIGSAFDLSAGNGAAAGLFGSLTSEYNQMLTDPAMQKRILEFNEENHDPTTRARFLTGLLQENPRAMSAMAGLHDLRSDRTSSNQQSYLDLASLLSKSGTQSPIGVDIEGMRRQVSGISNLPQGSRERDAFIKESVGMAVKGLGGRREGLLGGALGSYVGTALLGPMGMGAGALFGGSNLTDLFAGISEEQITSALTGEFSTDVAQELGGGRRTSGLNNLLAKDPEGVVAKILQQTSGLDPEKKKMVADAFGRMAALKGSDVDKSTSKSWRDIAGRESSALSGLTGLSSDARRSLEKAFGMLGGEGDVQRQGLQALRDLSGSLSPTDIDALRRGGGSFGGQVSALGALRRGVGKAGQTEDQFRGDVRRQLSSAVGYDVFEALKNIDKDAYDNSMRAFSADSEGGAKVTESERRIIQQNLSKALDPALAQERRTEKEDLTGKMAEQLRQYTEANTQFVTAVGIAVPALQDKGLGEKMFQKGRELEESATKAKGG